MTCKQMVKLLFLQGIKYTFFMKKIITLLFMALIVSMCSLDESNRFTEQSLNEEGGFVMLRDDILKYNQEFGINTQTRSPFLRKMSFIAAGDALGFLFNSLSPGIGLFTSIINSITCAAVYDEEVTFAEEDEPLYDEEEVPIDEMDSLGILHNETLMMISNEISDSLVLNGSLNEVFTIVKNGLSASSSEINNVTFAQCEQFLLNSRIIINLCEDYDLFGAYESEFEQYEQELSIVEDYCLAINVLENRGDIRGYTSGLRNIIISSSIPEESKRIIRGMISIAGNSHLLWSCGGSEDEDLEIEEPDPDEELLH